MSNVSKNISYDDQKRIDGFSDIQYPEPEQFLFSHLVDGEAPPQESQDRLKQLKERAGEVLDRINNITEKIDSRCKRFSITYPEKEGSRLWQAMFRLFGKGTNTVTYEDYIKALELREQRSKEGQAKVRAL